MPTETHIIPLLVGCAEKCKTASDRLLVKHGIYIQPINFPTVPKGTERLRITPTPHHRDVHIDGLTRALVDVWEVIGPKRPTLEEQNKSAAIASPPLSRWTRGIRVSSNHGIIGDVHKAAVAEKWAM